MKKALFEYFLKKIVDWYCDYYSIDLQSFNMHDKNDLSKLKVIKLHFFACATTPSTLDIFDSFYAMPYGHVESDVYASLHDLDYFEVLNSKLVIKDILNLPGQMPNSNLIDLCVNQLRLENPKLIALTPFELVELSHRWFSWRYNFNEARKNNQFSKLISSKLIDEENKIYSLH